jgi:membrane associated rhomboid family serine protease
MDYGQYGGLALPRVTSGVKALLIVNAAVFFANALAQDWFGDVLLPLSWSGLWEGYGLGVLRLVTYQFVHAFTDPWHILLNMLLLYFFGTFVEAEIGRRRLLWLYLLSGIAGGLLHMLLAPSARVVGASGACYGILVYAAFMAPRMRVIFLIFPIEMRWLVGFLVFLGLYQVYVEMALGVSGGVSHGAHLGGALWGLVAFRMARAGVGPDFGLGERWARMRAQRSARASAQHRAVLDGLLDKVQREGLSSLTAAERRFLDKASERMRRK